VSAAETAVAIFSALPSAAPTSAWKTCTTIAWPPPMSSHSVV